VSRPHKQHVVVYALKADDEGIPVQVALLHTHFEDLTLPPLNGDWVYKIEEEECDCVEYNESGSN